MTDFKAKMHQIRFRLDSPAGGAYSTPPDPLAGFGGRSRQGRGWAGEEEGKGEGKGRQGEVEGRAPMLLLNKDPSETCYATGSKALTMLVSLTNKLSPSYRVIFVSVFSVFLLMF